MRTATTVLAITVAALLTLGSIVLYSAMMTEPALAKHLDKQLVFVVLGLALCCAVAIYDYQSFKKWQVWAVYGIAIILLMLVFAPAVGSTQLGAARWIKIAGFSFQSSEFAKGALILALAAYVDRHQRKMRTFKYGIIFPSLIIGPIIGLIFLEPDIGTTLTLGAVVSIMLLVGGVKWSHAVCIAGVGLACVVGYVSQNPVRLNRIDAFLHPEDHATGAAMQAEYSLKALRTGGITGVGLGDSRWKQRAYIPLHYSDFIYSVIGAELGLIGAMSTLILYVIVLICGVYISWHARDLFGMLVAAGLTFFICMQAFIHMGVVMAVLPNKGFPLPFISHGGTNLMFNLVAVGLLISIGRRGLVRVKSNNPFDRHVEVPVAGTV